ncbi:MAG: hypothetical protein EZS28_005305 [Streblomastix strix]|uniref:Tc1-like transposase DDE domain-containing protein n=1 Tax=Streblomastix strix TaxID=222440 RepID=A0A5J4WWH4_9EUKA|nr:MAG: hypothetical protein EZS28_005305 [Streblomastix strix]
MAQTSFSSKIMPLVTKKNDVLKGSHLHEMEILQWSACSSDLSPIENVWSIIARKIYADKGTFDSEDELQLQLDQVIRGLIQEEINLFDESIENKILILTAHISHKIKPLNCGVNARLKQKMREVFKYSKDSSASSLRVAFVKALKTAVNQALDSEVLNV